MAETQANAISLIKAWFDKADKWQKDLFCQIWQGNEDVEKLTAQVHKRYLHIAMMAKNIKFTGNQA